MKSWRQRLCFVAYSNVCVEVAYIKVSKCVKYLLRFGRETVVSRVIANFVLQNCARID